MRKDCLQKRNAQLAVAYQICQRQSSTSSSHRLHARNSCDVFKDAVFPRILLPRVGKDFALHAADTSFARSELAKLKLSKASRLDKISVKLLKDAASFIAKPVTYLINLTTRRVKIPSQWKEARVTPMYKTGKKDDDNNYRPNSVLPLVSKGMERAIQVQLLSFLDDNKVLSVFQSDFRKKHSTEIELYTLLTIF